MDIGPTHPLTHRHVAVCAPQQQTTRSHCSNITLAREGNIKSNTWDASCKNISPVSSPFRCTVPYWNFLTNLHLHDPHCSANNRLFALSLLLSSTESLMVLVLYTWVWLTSARLLTGLLCMALLPRSIWLTSIITQQSIWHWDHRNPVIRVYMKRPWHVPEIINTSYTQYRGFIWV